MLLIVGRSCLKVTSVSQLLILAGNCRYVRNRVLPDLAMEYEGMINFRLGGNTSGTTKISVAEAHFRELEDLLISSYTKEVKKRLDQLVEQSLADKKSPAKPGDILGVSNNPVEWVHYIIGIQVRWLAGREHLDNAFLFISLTGCCFLG